MEGNENHNEETHIPSEIKQIKFLKRKLEPKVLPKNIRDWDLIMEHIKRERGE